MLALRPAAPDSRAEVAKLGHNTQKAHKRNAKQKTQATHSKGIAKAHLDLVLIAEAVV